MNRKINRKPTIQKSMKNPHCGEPGHSTFNDGSLIHMYCAESVIDNKNNNDGLPSSAPNPNPTEHWHYLPASDASTSMQALRHRCLRHVAWWLHFCDDSNTALKHAQCALPRLHCKEALCKSSSKPASSNYIQIRAQKWDLWSWCVCQSNAQLSDQPQVSWVNIILCFWHDDTTQRK